jgi:long-chain acyl-CoA synthetase
MGEPVKQEFWQAAAAVEPNTLATIVYTSGTTGSPKGVMLTHGNLMTHPKYVDVGYNPQPGDIQMSILPAWHAYERAAEYYGISKGNTLAYSDKRYIKEDFVRLCPHLLPCVPRIWEMVYKTIYHKINSATPRQQKLFNFFISAGRQYVYARREVNGERVSAEKVQPLARFANLLKMLALAPIYSLGDKLVFAKMRQITGGRLRAAISGGGSLAPYLDDFFEIVGIPILNGYGLTETAPVLTLRTLQHNVRGSVGRPLSHTQISIRTETGDELPQGQAGEIWARGPQIMLGYYQNPEATAKVLKDGGWFCTGDLGWVTSGGDVIISGRAKDTIVLSSGENVEPEPIEDACRKSPLVQQIVIVGQDQKTLGALVVPDFAELATQLSLPGETPSTEIVEREDAKKIIKSALAQVMATEGRFKAAESISNVFLLPEAFTEKNGMMTSTMKIKRNVVAERYKEQIKALFEN